MTSKSGSYKFDVSSTQSYDSESNANMEVSDSFLASTSNINSKKVNDELKHRSNLTVEEIFARGIEEWRQARELVKKHYQIEGKLPPPGLRPPRSMRGTTFNGYDAKFDKEVENILAPNRRKLFETDEQTSMERKSGYDEYEALREESSSLPRYMNVIERQKLHQKHHHEAAIASHTETPEVSSDDHHLHKMKLWCDYAADVLRVVVVLGVSFVLTGLPWFFKSRNEVPPNIEFNLTESNICYWVGSPGFLDPLNPCSYRGYVSINQKGQNCIAWNKVMENSTWVAKLESETKEQAGVLPRVFLNQVRKMAKINNGEDYNSPYCRRIGDYTRLNNENSSHGYEDISNAPKCFVIKGENGTSLDTPRISNCWVVPCSLDLSSECFKKWFMRKREARLKNETDQKMPT